MILHQKKVKIIATIGPSSSSEAMIEKLIRNGVNLFRLNLSHGTHEDHKKAATQIRNISRKLETETGIIADLQGPKIRTRSTANNEVITLTTGDQVRITSEKVICTTSVIAIDYPDIASEIEIGQQIMINDGAIRLEITAKHDCGDLDAKVTSGGEYSSHKGVNLPNVKLRIPSLTEKDLKDLEFILDMDIQYIALSFVRDAGDVKALREIVNKKRTDIKIISKIEKPEAAEHISEILEHSDGIMVARGDLGVEMTPYVVPIIQKDMIHKANSAGKIVIVATQMLESMIHQKMPTRAESTDVANAIIDGTDAIMLSGETAVGINPDEAVLTMTRIAQVTEQSNYIPRATQVIPTLDHYPPHAICDAAVLAGRDLNGIPLCVFTMSGETAFYLANRRYQAPIYAFSPDWHVVKALSIAWNTIAFHLPFSQTIAQLHKDGESILLQNSLIRQGDLIGIISGATGVCGATDSFRIKKIGSE
jgi:pyruvate kinase